MSRRIIASLLAVLFVASVFGMAVASKPEGNFRKGKYLYRKNCRTCHDGSQAKDLSPADKVQAKWVELYNNTGQIPCSDEWGGMSEQDLTDIFTYMHDFAKDSPTPAKCS
jgi:mono/diheme cytochrome c family protein